MGCGCKNQGNQTPPPAQTSTQTGQSQPASQPIQESIRKVVQRYYTEK